MTKFKVWITNSGLCLPTNGCTTEVYEPKFESVISTNWFANHKLFRICAWPDYGQQFIDDFILYIYHFIVGWICVRCKKWLGETHWRRRATYICVSTQTTIGSGNGLSPCGRQAIIWTIAGILFIVPLGRNFGEILIEIYIFSFKKMPLKMSSGNWRQFCLGLNVLTMCMYTCDPLWAPSQYKDRLIYVWRFPC